MIRRSSNPVLSDRMMRNIPSVGGDVMTIDGTVNKSLISLGITVVTAYWAFGDPTLRSMYIPALLAAFVLGLIIGFKPTTAPMLTPVYAAIEGVFVGSVSFVYASFQQGIVFQAVCLTFTIFFCMLMAYKSGWIRATPVLKRTLSIGLMAISVFYLAAFVFWMAGAPFSFLHSGSPLSIGLSVLLVGWASFTLILDFDLIESLSQHNSPKYMEWYGAFALLVTVVWLYLEVLRLLSNLQNRD